MFNKCLFSVLTLIFYMHLADVLSKATYIAFRLHIVFISMFFWLPNHTMVGGVSGYRPSLHSNTQMWQKFCIVVHLDKIIFRSCRLITEKCLEMMWFHRCFASDGFLCREEVFVELLVCDSAAVCVSIKLNRCSSVLV